MLQNLREHAQGWIASVIIVILCLAFALWGMEYYITGNHATNTAAKVNGTEITQQEVESVYKRLRQTQQVDTIVGTLDTATQKQLRHTALQQLINQRVLSQAAIDNGYRISNQQMGAILAQVPAFQSNGQFSLPIFQQAISAFFPSQQAFFNDLRQNSLVAQAKIGIVSSAFALPNEVKNAVALLDQKRDISYLIISAKSFLPHVTVSDAAIKHYYETHQQAYMNPEQVKIQYLELSAPVLNKKVVLSAQELEQYYADNKLAFSTPGQWQIAQIIIKVPEDADQKMVLTAQQKIEKINQALKNGENFAALAVQFSDDKTSAIQGGMKGWVSSVSIEPVLATLLNNLQPGQVSAPFRTSEGFNLIKLLAVKKPLAKPFALVKIDVEKSLRQQKMEQLIATDSDQLQNLTYTNPDSLKPAADALGLPIVTSGFFTAQGQGGAGVTANRKIIAVAFSDNVLKQHNNSDLLTLDNQTAVVIRVAEYKPAVARSLDEVQPQITAQLKLDAAKNAAKQLGEKLVSLIKKEDKAANALLKDNQLTWITDPAANRQTTTITPEILAFAFSLPIPTSEHQPTVGSVMLTNGDYSLVSVRLVSNGSETAVAPAKLAEIRQQLALDFGLFDYSLYVAKYMQAAKIKEISN